MRPSPLFAEKDGIFDFTNSLRARRLFESRPNRRTNQRLVYKGCPMRYNTDCSGFCCSSAVKLLTTGSV